jgi:16S rRNA (cytosine967-C5)-methyltransferase
MLVSRVAAPHAGAAVLDLCAAPGGKTTHLAALMGDVGRLVAVERHPGRAQALEETCRRMRASTVSVVVADAASWHSEDRFDHVLVDPPCSGLGTLQSRPDLRWRASAETIAELAESQLAILTSAARAARPGATLTYSVCTISVRESEEVVERFLTACPGFVADDLGALFPQWRHHRHPRFLQLLPHRDLTDGFFIARLRRIAAPPRRRAD